MNAQTAWVVEWAAQAMRNNYNILMQIAEIRAQLLALGATSDGAALLNPNGYVPYPGQNPDSWRIPYSHTGSLVTGDGIVNLQKGEIVVREDISRGLLQLIEIFNGKGTLSGAAQVVHQHNYNAPLQNVEKQVIEDHADARRGANDIGYLMFREIKKLPL